MSPEAFWSVVEVRPGAFEVAGEIDAHSAPALAARLSTATEGTVVLDLAGVTFMDSSGLRVIVQLIQSERKGGATLVIQRPSAPVARLFEIGGLSGLLQPNDV